MNLLVEQKGIWTPEWLLGDNPQFSSFAGKLLIKAFLTAALPLGYPPHDIIWCGEAGFEPAKPLGC